MLNITCNAAGQKQSSQSLTYKFDVLEEQKDVEANVIWILYSFNHKDVIALPFFLFVIHTFLSN